MKVLAKRGDNQFLVEIDQEKFALVTLGNKQRSSRIEDSADIFYKAGYFTDEKPTETELKEIEKILNR